MVKTGIGRLSDFKRTDNWTAEFQLSGAFAELKDKSNEDIIRIAEDALLNAPDFILEKSLRVLNSREGTFDADIIDTKHALSSSTYRKLIESIKDRKIKESTPTEKLVISVAVYGVIELYGRNTDVQREAEEEKEALLAALQNIDDFLKSAKKETK